MIPPVPYRASLAAPIVAWQATHGWPQLIVAEGISADDGWENRVMFVPLQLVMLSPALVPVWIAGLVRLWRDPAVHWARAISVAYLVLSAMILIVGGKSYYAVPLLLFVAAGAEPTLAWLTRARRPLTVALTAVVLITQHDNGIGLDNDEQGTPIALCDGPTAPWSALWPDLRNFS